MQVHDFLIQGSKPVRIVDEVVFVVPTLFPNNHLLLRRHREWSPRQGKGLAREEMLVRIAYPASLDLDQSSLNFVLTVNTTI
jgi:hypothetical protein